MAIESTFYVCGSPLFPDHHPLVDKLRIRTNLTCQSPIERSYYSNKTVHLPSVCAHCGEKECIVPQEMQSRPSYLPILYKQGAKSYYIHVYQSRN